MPQASHSMEDQVKNNAELRHMGNSISCAKKEKKIRLVALLSANGSSQLTAETFFFPVLFL